MKILLCKYLFKKELKIYIFYMLTKNDFDCNYLRYSKHISLDLKS